MAGVWEVFSWKRSFERLNSEYETVMKKRQALNSLLESGRISRPTYELFESEMNEAIAEIERQRKALLDKMAVKARELEEQVRTLEKLLANFEIQHVGGEIEEEVYQREVSLLSMGLESTRQELNAIKETIEKLASPQMAESTQSQQQAEQKPAESGETGSLEVAVVEITPKVEAEGASVSENLQEPRQEEQIERKSEG
ncbi:MAG: CdvA-like protein [Candidatus Bathyarchaeia archaeon]